jgi:hypothetical protein
MAAERRIRTELLDRLVNLGRENGQEIEDMVEKAIAQYLDREEHNEAMTRHYAYRLAGRPGVVHRSRDAA